MSAAGLRLWDDVTAAVELGPVEAVFLEQACRCADRLELLATTAAAGDVAAIREERLTSQVQARMLRALRLPDAVTGQRPQRRGGPRGVYRHR
jgi:hypothetical protein